MPLHTDAMIAGVIALKLSPQRSNKNKNKDAVKILISVGWLTFDPVNSHPVDNPHRPPIGRAEKARFQFEYFRLRTRYRKDKRVSRDFARLVTHLSTSGRSRGPRITCRIASDRAAAVAGCYGRYCKRPDDKINKRRWADAGVPILTPVRSSRLESRDGVT